MIMSQRLQSIFFFFSALLLALLFFLPFASFYGDFHTFDLFGYGITSPDNWENGASPFSMTFSLPILVLTVTAMVLCGYLAMGLFRAIKLSQFQKLHKIARIAIIVIVACIAALLGYSYFIIPKMAQSVDIRSGFQGRCGVPDHCPRLDDPRFFGFEEGHQQGACHRPHPLIGAK